MQFLKIILIFFCIVLLHVQCKNKEPEVEYKRKVYQQFMKITNGKFSPYEPKYPELILTINQKIDSLARQDSLISLAINNDKSKSNQLILK